MTTTPKTTLPEKFSTYTREILGEQRWTRFAEAMDEEPPVSVRLNPMKFRSDSMALPAEEDEPVEWCREGRYLKERPMFTLDPLLHAGAYYVQEAASMYITQVIRDHAPADRPLMVLDLCAAPGGKSTAMRSVLPEGSLLMTNEPMRPRANILMENIQKFGHPDVIVTNNYAIDYQRSRLQFDVILADVPCSGEGMFRKDEGAIREWSVANVKKCAALQREIITDIMPCLRDGGLLVYSTCTYNRQEDEENVDFICSEWQMEKLSERHFIPGETRSEGLYMAALRQTGSDASQQTTISMLDSSTTKKDKKQKRRGKASAEQAVKGAKEMSGWIKDNEDFSITTLGQRFVAVRKQWRNVYDTALEKLRVMHAGIELGEPKGKDIIPSECLALSTAFNPEAFATTELDRDTAIAYLRREPIQLPPDTPRGFVAVGYQGLNLGFVKNLGNRTNNLFPQEWRIRMQNDA
ncbi:methyltransferase RsmF C-terminal domain-like protein [Prevotella pectinovora]|uniref:methyltransferase RsmF C-terminal domain-like protein n=1 Tax=Prevotella pectinovora TaxID=1602169 RepID=UPI002FDAD6EB